MARVRTQIYLEKRQYERLREEAFKQRISLSELLRRLIEEAFFAEPAGASPESALEFVGKGRDKRRDVAREHDRYLAGSG